MTRSFDFGAGGFRGHEHQNRRTLITKGAAEGILPLLSTYEVDGKVEPITENALKRLQQTSNGLNSQGFRSLAVAYADVPVRTNYSVGDERGLTLAGFLSFSDEPLPDAEQALAALKQDGLEVKIISGDNDRVTDHVCTLVGIDHGQIVTGEEMDRVTDPALRIRPKTQVSSPAFRRVRKIAFFWHSNTIATPWDSWATVSMMRPLFARPTSASLCPMPLT